MPLFQGLPGGGARRIFHRLVHRSSTIAVSREETNEGTGRKIPGGNLRVNVKRNFKFGIILRNLQGLGELSIFDSFVGV